MMISDPLLGKYYVVSKDKQLTVCYVTKKGQEKIVGYYTDVHHAIKVAAKFAMMDRDATYTIAEYLKEYKDIMNKFKSLWETKH